MVDAGCPARVGARRLDSHQIDGAPGNAQRGGRSRPNTDVPPRMTRALRALRGCRLQPVPD